MRDVLIDLGELPPSTGARAGIVAGPRPFPVRVLLGAACALLLAMLAGAAHRGPPPAPTIIPARLGDTTFVDGDRLFVVSAGRPALGTAVADRAISTYALPSGKLLGVTSVAVAGGVTGVWQGAGTIVVTYQIEREAAWAVAALTAGTRLELWRRNARFIGASAADHLVVLGTDTAEQGVDLRTGAVRWAVARRADGFTATAGPAAGFAPWLVTVTDSGLLQTRDLRTGTVLGENRVPPLPGRANGMIWPVGNLMLVDTGDGGYEGYRLPELVREFRTSADLSSSWTQAQCGRMICTFRQQTGMTALDAGTGRELWRSGRWAYAEAVDRYLVATAYGKTPTMPSLWVLDPPTGKVLGDFGDWQVLGRGPDGRLYGRLDLRGKYQMFFGELEPATRHVRILGHAERVSGDCQIGSGVLMCRLIGASIGLWRLG